MNINKQSGFAHIWLLAVVVILCIGGAGYYVWQQKEETQKITNKDADSSTPSQASQTLKPSQVTNEINTALDKKYVLLDIDTNNQPKEGEISVRLEERSPAYKVDGYNFYTNYAGGSSLDIVASTYTGLTWPNYEKEATIRKEIATIFEQQGLVFKTTYGNVDNSTGTNVYEGKGLVCTLESPEIQSSSISAICGELAAYKDAAATAAPFAQLLTKGNQDSSTLFINSPKIEDSKTPGYKITTISVGDINDGGGYAALFYINGDGPWKFFKGTQEGIACSEYNTQELRNAYKGDDCYKDTDGTLDTVQ